MRRIILLLVVLSLLGGGAFLLLGAAEPSVASDTDSVRVRRGTLVELASATGTVEPDVFVEVKPRSSGEVVEVAAAEGQRVAAGDVLLRLDPTEREENLRDAEASLAQTESKREQAKATLAVARAQATEASAHAAVRKRGEARGLVSTEERREADSAAKVARVTVTLREAELAGAEAAVVQAELRVTAARRLLDEMTIRAPIDATVLSIAVERGSVVSSGITNVGGGTAVLTLADLATLLVIGHLDESQVGRVHEGQDVVVRVDAFPDRTFEGHVKRVSPLGQTTSNVVTFDIEIALVGDAAQFLRSGMSADIEVVVSRHEDALLLPVAGLHSRGQERYVVLASGERRAVRTGATDGADIVLLDGLAEGDAAVVGGVAPKPAARAGASKGGSPFAMSGPRH